MTRRFINALQVELPEDPGGLDLGAQARGIIAEPTSPASLASSLAPGSQLLFGDLVAMPERTVVTSMITNVATAGAGTAPTLIKMGIYSVSGDRLAQTANVAGDAMWTSTGQKIIPLTAPYTVPWTTGYYLVFLKNGAFATTDIALSRWNIGQILTTGIGQVQVGSGARAFALVAGQSDLAASVTWANGTQAFYMACA